MSASNAGATTMQSEHVLKKEKVPSKKDSARARSVYLAWTASILSVTLIFAFQSHYSTLIGPFSNIITPIVAGTALFSSYRCLPRYGFNLRGKFDRVWIYFTLGMASWTIAEVTWGIYYFILKIPVPYPSVADFFYIGAYFPLSLALLTYFHTFRAGMTKQMTLVSVGAIAVCCALVLGFVVPVEFAKTQPLLTALTNSIYPILDLLLISLTILSVVLFVRGTLGRWWAVLATGIVLDIIGDEVFLYLSARGMYYNGSFDDLFYIAAYFMFALAFYVHRTKL